MNISTEYTSDLLKFILICVSLSVSTLHCCASLINFLLTLWSAMYTNSTELSLYCYNIVLYLYCYNILLLRYIILLLRYNILLLQHCYGTFFVLLRYNIILLQYSKLVRYNTLYCNVCRAGSETPDSRTVSCFKLSKYGSTKELYYIQMA